MGVTWEAEVGAKARAINKLTITMSAFSVDDVTVTDVEWPLSRIRNAFIEYFVEREHTFWPSSPVVPFDDPTLLFINAGMNQYKPLFLGTCDPSLEMNQLKRAVNSQKCIRAGGKHNDLEDVGKDVYHHTYFEMLGNWSFGDYFKEEAIQWGYDCLTNTYGLDPARLYATYFGGDEEQGLVADEDARQIWLRYLPEERVLPFGCQDNFWEMGATGPCGPCSEIHYDRIGNRNAGDRVNADFPDVIEIWNIVFIQYNRENDGTLKELPNKHVDTGMGLERLCSILQGKDSNYDTDVFTPIFSAISEICKCRKYSGLVGLDDTDRIDMAYRVVADHIRTLCFAIVDGATPSSEGRGYVLRRILRRAVRYGQEMLNAPNGFFAKLVPCVVDNFSDFFPELQTRKELIMGIISDEEASFVRTLDKGVKYFKKLVQDLQSAEKNTIPGEEAHKLFGSLGFPLDLTQVMAEEVNMDVDVDAFDELMENDRKISEMAELARKGGGSKDLTMVAEQTSWLASHGILSTDATQKYVWEETSAKVVALYTGRDESGSENAGFVDKISHKDGIVGLIVNETSFYYESGGQIYDTGKIVFENDNTQTVFNVENTQVYAGYVVHVGYIQNAERQINVGMSCLLQVDYERRSLIAPNHTMTHVLNFALRQVLAETTGPKKSIKDDNNDKPKLKQEVDQRGSLVDEDKLRFDFSWSKALSVVELAEVESIVNKQIAESYTVYSEVVPLTKAKEIQSLRSVFGESYPDPVRVISVGAMIEDVLNSPKDPKWSMHSVEFCGGTHLSNTAEAESFQLLEESGIAKGIRRIVGVTRRGAQIARVTADELSKRLDILESMETNEQLNDSYKILSVDLSKAQISVVRKHEMKCRLEIVLNKIKKWQKAALASKVKVACEKAEDATKEAINSQSEIIVLHLDNIDGSVSKKVMDAIKKLCDNISFLMYSLDTNSQKIGLYTYVCKKHIEEGLSAKEWIDHCFISTGTGKGGGKSDSAFGNIPGDLQKTEIFLPAAEAYIGERKVIRFN